jgi:hypothetical protein
MVGTAFTREGKKGAFQKHRFSSDSLGNEQRTQQVDKVTIFPFDE